MKFDFSSVPDRSGKDAVALDAIGLPGFIPKPKKGFSIIPMWIADMNFATAPGIPQAIAERLQHPLFGYYIPRPEYYEGIIRWQQSRNKVEDLLSEHIGYENGVLGGVISALNVICSRGGKVLIHAPNYVGFTEALTVNGYNMVFSSLTLDENNIWRMDYADMEEKLSKEHIHAAIICSPHNPCGRVWERWELEKAFELFKKYDVYVISDEIWSDLTRPGFQHIPTQSISEDAKQRTIALYAPSKTFNLAGLVGSYHIIYNRWLRERIAAEEQLSQYNLMNLLSMYSLIGAYQPEGAEWVDELRQVLADNVDYACDYIQKHFEGVSFSKPQGTYMLFVDCTKWCERHGKTIDQVTQAAWDVGVALQDGRQFHGPCHLRLNLALPMACLEDAFDRLNHYVFNADLI